MSKHNDFSSPELSQNVWEKIREILKQVSTLLEQHIKELKTVPASVIIRFKEEVQQASLNMLRDYREATPFKFSMLYSCSFWNLRRRTFGHFSGSG